METTNHECYVSPEVAKLLKEAGFDWEVNTCRYNSSPDKVSSNGTLKSNFNGYAFQHIAISAPTLDVAQRWLREVKNIAVYVCPSYEPIENEDDKWIMKWEVSAMHYDIEDDQTDLGDIEDEIFDTYESALESGIKKALELVLGKRE